MRGPVPGRIVRGAARGRGQSHAARRYRHRDQRPFRKSRRALCPGRPAGRYPDRHGGVSMAGTVPATNTVPAIALDGLSKSFARGAHFALRDICLSLASGDLVALFGDSGSGTNTLLKLLNPQVEPASGTLPVP